MNNILRIDASTQTKSNNYDEKNADTAFQFINKIHPVQDFHNEHMYYGLNKDGKDMVINSELERIPVTELNRKGLEPIIKKLTHMGNSSILANDTFLKNIHSLKIEDLFINIKRYYKRFLYLSEEYYDLLSLWSMGTYVFKMFPAYPYIHFNAEKGSGKTTALKLLQGICFNAQSASSATKPIFYRLVHNNLPTLLLDEAEHFSSKGKRDNGILEVVKSGYDEAGVSLLMGGTDYSEILTFTTYCPKAFAGIEMLDPVLSDRTIKIPINRMPKPNLVEQYIPKERDIQQMQKEIQSQLYLLGLRYGTELYNIYCNLQEEPWYTLTNRHHQLWAPLFAIAILLEDNSQTLSLKDSIISLAMQDKERKSLRQRDEIYIGILNELFSIVDESDGGEYGAVPRGSLFQVNSSIVFDKFINLDIIPNHWKKRDLTIYLSGKEIAQSGSSNSSRKYFIDIAKVREEYKSYCYEIDNTFQDYC